MRRVKFYDEDGNEKIVVLSKQGYFSHIVGSDMTIGKRRAGLAYIEEALLRLGYRRHKGRRRRGALYVRMKNKRGSRHEHS